MENMDSSLKLFLHDQFAPYCESLGAFNLFDDLLNQLEKIVPIEAQHHPSSTTVRHTTHEHNVHGTEKFLHGLIKRCVFGNASDRMEYVLTHLIMPLGPRLKLLHLLEHSSFLTDLQTMLALPNCKNEIEEVLDLKVRNVAFEQVMRQSVLHQVWEEWKAGQMTTSDLFAKFNYFLHEKFIDLKAYQFIVDAVLVDQGYASYLHRFESEEGVEEEENKAIVNLTTHVSYLLPHIPFDSVLSLQCKRENRVLSIATLDQRAMTLDLQGKINQRRLHSFPSTSNHRVWWIYRGTCDHLSIAHPASSDEEAIPGVAIVVIGDHLRFERGVLEIDQVQSFDSLPTRNDLKNGNGFEFALVVQGRWKCLLDQSSECFLHEGGTDAGGMDEFDNSPNGSGNEGSQQIIPDYSFPNQYFLIVGMVLNDYVLIRTVHCLSDVLFPDQTPTHVRLFSDSFGVIAGSNGLLSAFQVNRGKSSRLEHYWMRPGEGESLDFDCSVLVKLLPDDSLLAHEELQSQYTLSHYSDSAIHSFDYCLHSSLLVSVDSVGTICIWKVSPTLNDIHFRLIAPPHSGWCCARVEQIHFSPSGDHLIICLLDRVQLMKITIPTDESSHSSATMMSSFSWMYERCCLDLSPNRICKYHVVFKEKEITIWKIMEEESCSRGLHEEEESGVVISCWTHRNVDSFLHRQSQYTVTTAMSKYSPHSHHLCPSGRKEACSETDQASLDHDLSSQVTIMKYETMMECDEEMSEEGLNSSE